jgi:hypothetical protein
MFLVYEALMRRAKVQSPENPVARENRAHQKERQKPTSRAPEETRSTVLAAHHQHPNPIRNPFPNGLPKTPCPAQPPTPSAIPVTATLKERSPQ